MSRFLGTLARFAAAGATIGLLVVAAWAVQDGGRPPGPGSQPPGPGGPGGPPPGFGPGMFLGPAILEAADANKDGRLSPEEASGAAGRFVREADRDKKGGLDLAALREAINAKLGPPPGADDGGGPPPGFGPGMFLGPRVLELADANKDGKLTAEEASGAAERFVREADRDKKGLDEEGMIAAVNRQMGPPPGFGPGGPMGGQERELVKTYDKDGNSRLDRQERRAARESLKKERANNPRGGRGGFGPPPGFGGGGPEARPGPRVRPSEVATFPASKGLYEPDVLRTIFLTFENDDWESEMEDFHNSDVEIPAEMTVDGKGYRGVGVHFRGMSSYMGVRAGHKRSLNVSVDFTDGDQKLYGYKTLNLLNSHEDSSFLHTVLYSRIARAYIPAPKANFVRVVINGESWGVYVNAQQFDKIFVAENYGSSKGARWKVRGNPGADGGLRYLGDELDEYQRRFEMKSGGKKDWQALVALCKTLNETPPERLEAALSPMLDIDGVLWFLAVDNALINGDGYWTRASDYSLFRDQAGKFHLIPHDMNEAFGPAMMFGPGGPGGMMRGGRGGRGMMGGGRGGMFGGRGGMPGGPGGPGGMPGGRGGPMGGPGGPRPTNVDLDPLIGLDNARTPLRGRLLSVPSLRARYLEHVKTIADDWLDWKKLGPVVAGYRNLIEKAVEEDTRKLSSTEAFRAAVADAPAAEATPRGRPSMSLRTFADRRRAYLLDQIAKKGDAR